MVPYKTTDGRIFIVAKIQGRVDEWLLPGRMFMVA